MRQHYIDTLDPEADEFLLRMQTVDSDTTEPYQRAAEILPRPECRDELYYDEWRPGFGSKPHWVRFTTKQVFPY
jgi:hypothetical protein